MLTTRSTLRGKLLLAFLSLVTVITVAGTIVRQGTDEIGAAFRDTHDGNMPATEALRDARLALTRLVAEAEGFLVTHDAREARNFEVAVRALWTACDEYRASIERVSPAGEPVGARRMETTYGAVRRESGKVVRSGERVLALRPRAHQVERLVAWSKVWQAYGRAAPVLDGAIAREADELRRHTEQVDLAIMRLRTGSLLSTCFALGLAVIMGIFLAQSIRRPIVKLRAAAERIGQGEFSVRIGSTRRDEIGDVARAVDEMAARLERLDFVQGLLDGLPEVVLVLDADGRIVRHNRGLALSPGQTAGTWWDLLGPAASARAREALERVARDKQMRVQVDTASTVGGEHYLWTLVRFAESGIVVSGQDITTRRQAELELIRGRENAVEASRRKSEFLARMSHDFRTPLHGIFGMTDLLLETSLIAEQREFAEGVRRSAEGLVTIIDEVFDFARLDTGQLVLDAVDFSPGKVVEDVLLVVAPRAAAKNLELSCLVHSEVPPLLRGDPGRLRQVLLNLLGNALKFTTVGRIVVRVEVEETLGERTVLYVSVTDTGIGVPVAEQRRLFETLGPGDEAVEHEQGGAGLGLAICRRLVEMMGGEIGVESEPGRGSCFWFTIPLQGRTGLRLPGLARTGT